MHFPPYGSFPGWAAENPADLKKCYPMAPLCDVDGPLVAFGALPMFRSLKPQDASRQTHDKQNRLSAMHSTPAAQPYARCHTQSLGRLKGQE